MSGVEKFRDAGLAVLKLSTDPNAARAIEEMQKPGWGGSVATHGGDDYIALSIPGHRRDTLIFDNAKYGINGARIANAMLSIVRHDADKEHTQRIRDANTVLTGRARNMMTHLKHPCVTVMPSETRQGFVRLNGWGEFDEEGLRVVYAALKAADDAIEKEKH